MNQAQIRQEIAQIVSGNLRYSDPFDKMNLEKGQAVGVKGFTTQSAEEALADIIMDLQSLEQEVMIEGSMQSAQL
jgi:hypothetical protein